MKLIIENTVIDDSTNTVSTDTIDTAKFSRADYNSYRNTYIEFLENEPNISITITVIIST